MKTKGFTLIELLIAIAIVVILAIVSIVSLSGFRQNQALRLAGQNLVTFLRDAQQKSVGQENNIQWGVRFTHQAGGRDSYQLINGISTFNPAGATVALPSNIELASGYGDLTFNKLGLPDAPTTIIIRLVGQPTVTTRINVNAQGTITEN